MYKTIEAIYENGKIIPLVDEIPSKRARVLLTIVEDIEESEPEGLTFGHLEKYQGIFERFPEGLEYQKELRDEW